MNISADVLVLLVWTVHTDIANWGVCCWLGQWRYWQVCVGLVRCLMVIGEVCNIGEVHY